MAAILLVLLSCLSADTLELRAGASAVVAGTGTTVTFEQVRDDSRCPTGVSCIWEGDAIVVLRLRRGTEEDVNVELHANPRFSRQASAHGVTVLLETLEPHPEADKAIPAAAYVVRLLATAR